MDLSTPLQYVKGIGPARAEMLAAKRLLTVADLLYYAPFRYEDRTNVKTIDQLAPGEKAAVIVRVAAAKLTGFRRKSLGCLRSHFATAALVVCWPAGFMASVMPIVCFQILG